MPFNPYLRALFSHHLVAVSPLSHEYLIRLQAPLLVLLDQLLAQRNNSESFSLPHLHPLVLSIASLLRQTPRNNAVIQLMIAVLRCVSLDENTCSHIVATLRMLPVKEHIELVRQLSSRAPSPALLIPLVRFYLDVSCDVDVTYFDDFAALVGSLLSIASAPIADADATSIVCKLLTKKNDSRSALQLALDLTERFVHAPPQLHLIVSSLCAAASLVVEADKSGTHLPFARLASLVLTRGGSALYTLPMFAAVASIYQASLSASDEVLIKLIRQFEAHDITLSNVNYQWGKTISLPITMPLSPQDFGATLFESRVVDHSRLVNAIRSFPFTFLLTKHLISSNDTYDPHFLLPFALQCLLRFNVDLRRFAEAGFLSFAICGLASDDESLRKTSYAVVASALAQLEKAMFRDRDQLVLLLHALRRSIGEQYLKIPAIFAQFMAQAVFVLLKPEHFLFPPINKFLLARPVLDLHDVPLLYECISSSGVHFRRERLWLLGVLRGGLASEEV